MKTRAMLRVLTAATTLAFASAAAAGPPEAKPSQAKPDAQQDAAATAKARRLHIEGDALFEKGDYARAREVYLQAWALKKHYQIAGNLGDAEAKLGLWVDAAEHLGYYVHNSPKNDPAPQSATQLYIEVLARLAVMTIVVDAEGAEVMVDGRKIGTAPLPDQVRLLPGKHTVEARRGALVATKEVVLESNEVKTLHLSLLAERPDAPPVSMPLKQASTKEAAAAQASPEHTSPRDASLPQDEAAEKSMVLFGAGAAVTSLGIASGVLMTVLANHKSALADDLRVGNGGPSECYRKGTGECEALMSAVDGMDAFTGAAAVSFVIAGLAGGATVAYMLLPMPWEKKQGEEKAGTGARATPWIGVHGAGLSMGGRF